MQKLKFSKKYIKYKFIKNKNLKFLKKIFINNLKKYYLKEYCIFYTFTTFEQTQNFFRKKRQFKIVHKFRFLQTLKI